MAPVLLPIFIVSANAPVPIDIVLSPCVPILMAWSLSSLPILMAPAEEFTWIAPVASKSIEAVFVVVKSLELLIPIIVEPPSWILTPLLPPSVRAPADVVKLEAASPVKVMVAFSTVRSSCK